LVNPGTRQEVAGKVMVQVAPPGWAVTVVVVGAGDPVGTLTVTSPLCATAVGVPGVPGASTDGVIGVDPGDAGEVPLGDSATAVNVYAVPLVSGVMKQDVAGNVMTQVAPPGLAVTVVVVGAGVPVGTVTVTPPLPGVPVGVPGVPGIDANGVTPLESDEVALVPAGLVAVVLNV